MGGSQECPLAALLLFANLLKSLVDFADDVLLPCHHLLLSCFELFLNQGWQVLLGLLLLFQFTDAFVLFVNYLLKFNFFLVELVDLLGKVGLHVCKSPAYFFFDLLTALLPGLGLQLLLCVEDVELLELDLRLQGCNLLLEFLLVLCRSLIFHF